MVSLLCGQSTVVECKAGVRTETRKGSWRLWEPSRGKTAALIRMLPVVEVTRSGCIGII